MNRRIFIMFFILVPCAFLFSADGDAVELKGEPMDTILIVLDNLAGSGSYEIGFSTNEIKNLIDEPISASETIPVPVAPGSFYAFDDSVYFYWKLIGSVGNLTVSLKVETSQDLGWNVSWDRIPGAIPAGSISVGDGGKTVFSSSDNNVPKAGSIKLQVRSDDISTVPVGLYSIVVTATITGGTT